MTVVVLQSLGLAFILWLFSNTIGASIASAFILQGYNLRKWFGVLVACITILALVGCLLQHHIPLFMAAGLATVLFSSEYGYEIVE